MSIKSAIDINKGFLVSPLIANKANKYDCPICKTKVKLNKGECKICYFSHYEKDGCNYYSKEKYKEVKPEISDKEEVEKMTIENESIFHKEGKILLKGLIENGYKISFERKCQTSNCCKSLIIEAQPYCDNSKIELEYHMKHNDRSIYCDLAHIVDKEVKMIYEICYRHRTANENRPNNINWVDIDVKNIYDNVSNDEKTLVFKCIRYYECDDCKNYIIRQEEQRKKRIEANRLELLRKREEEEQRIAEKIEEQIKLKMQNENEKVKQNILKLEEARKKQLEKEEQKRKLKIEEQEMKNREEIKKKYGYLFTLWYLKTKTLRGKAKAIYKYRLKRFLGIYDHHDCCIDNTIFCKLCKGYRNLYKDFFTNN